MDSRGSTTCRGAAVPGRSGRAHSSTTTRTLPDADQALEHLLEAAAQTIARRGFAATRIADIADAARVSPAAVHYHFKVKEEILVRSLVWAHQRLIRELERGISGTRDPVARLAMLIERTIPYEGVPRDEYLLEIDL